MLRPVFAACLSIVALFSINAIAESKEVFDLSATSAEEFREQAQKLRNELDAGGQYVALSTKDKARIGSQLEVLQGLYDNREAGKKFGKTDEVKLINASEEINGLLSGDQDDRLICQQERKLGSNRTQRICLTLAERRAQSEEAKSDMRNQRIKVMDDRAN